MRKTKKLLSIILSAALVATALPATALAADGAGGSINGSGTIVDGLVYSVVVPSELKFVVNPLKFAYTNADGTLSSDQIISPGYGFTNTSSVPVQLDVNIKVVSNEGITIASAADQIKNSTNEAPTIFMDIEPATSEPTLVSATPLYVTFAGIDFVSGTALSTEETTISFKMNKANYALVGSTATYQNNDLSDDTVGFRFGGQASMFSDWEDLEIGVAATYAINGISDEAFANPDNVSSGTGYNVLNKNLLNSNSLVATGNDTLQLTAEDIYKNPTSGNYRAQGLFFVMSSRNANTPIDVAGMTLDDANIGDGVTNNGYTVTSMDMNMIDWTPSTGVLKFKSTAMDVLDTRDCAFFIKLADADGNIIVVATPSLHITK